VDQLCNNDLFKRYPLVRQQVSRTVFMMLLNGQPHTYFDEIRAVATPGAPRYIEGAYQYIMAHYDQEITIEELVETSGVSMRSLYAGFKRHKGVAPMAALKNRRLEAARDDLLRADPADSVTSVALKWGFVHLGNFSRDYFRRFGEHPSETLRNSSH
jgi:transcriptional regulator GlxA family with amidase domain